MTEPRSGPAHDAEFPHLYAHLEGENVESFKDVHKGDKSWSVALEEPEVSSWME